MAIIYKLYSYLLKKSFRQRKFRFAHPNGL